MYLKKINTSLLLILLTLSIAACGTDPRQEADAYAKRLQADQDAAAAAQQRQFAAEQHSNDMATAAYWADVWTSAKGTIKSGVNVIITLVCIALAGSLFGLVMRGTITVIDTVEGVGQAIQRKAIIRASLIPLDKDTGNYPLFVYEGHGKGLLINGNVQGVLPMDTRHEPDRQMINNSGAILMTQFIAQAAAKSQDPAGVSIIKTPAIQVTEEMITLAKELRNDE